MAQVLGKVHPIGPAGRDGGHGEVRGMSTPVYDVTPGAHVVQPPFQSDPSTLRRLDTVAATLSRFQGKAAVSLIALGLLAILLGFAGASSATAVTPGGREQVLIQAQFPYLISGGVFGLALVVLGSSLLVVQSARANSARTAAGLDRLADLIAAGGTGARGSAAAPDDVQGLVVAGSASYHQPNCRLVEGRADATYLLPVEAVSRGLLACRVCNPPAA